MTNNGSSRKRILTVTLLSAVVPMAFLAGYLPRKDTKRALDEAAERRRITPPAVNATQVKRSTPTSELLLPGSITPVTEAYVFARAAGYLKKRYVDIGDRVRAGQMLAEIDAPDLDQQVTQAQAALSQAQAQLGQTQATQEQLVATRNLAEVTWKRYSVLTETGAVSRQAGDQQFTSFKTSDANVSAGEKNVHAAQNFVNASEATLQRLITLQGYEQIRSPFDGIVTARNVDVGALISTAGASQGPARPAPAAPSDVPSSGEIFRVAEIRKLRVLISVPQTNAPDIQVGQAAKVTIQELPNRIFPGRVTRTSSSLDAGSRTLLTEVLVDNPTGVLLPGMYTSVQFVTQRSNPPFQVPDASLVVEAEGTSLALLDPLSAGEQDQAKSRGLDPNLLARTRRVHFQKVQAGRDYGLLLEILSGLKGGECVAVDPGDAVQEGALVQLAQPSKGAGQAGETPCQ